MKLQNARHNCGAVALINALMAAGHQSPNEDGMAKIAKTSPTRGTSSKGLRNALETLGLSEAVLSTKSALMAAEALIGCLQGGSPVLLCVDGGSHWVAAVGKLGSRFLVADSAEAELVLSLSREELLCRWGNDGNYYGIVVGERVEE